MSRQTFTATVEVTVENAPPGYTNANLADEIRDMVFGAISEETDLDVVVKQVWGPAEPLTVELDLDVTTDAPQQLVWVATVTDEVQAYGKPAIYVSPSEGDVIKVVRLQNGVPDDVDDNDLVEWFHEQQGAVLNFDSYYVEEGE